MSKWRVTLEIDDPDELTSSGLLNEIRETLDAHYISLTRSVIEPLDEVVKETDPTTGITHWKGMES